METIPRPALLRGVLRAVTGATGASGRITTMRGLLRPVVQLRAGNIPPPQPIFVPGATEDVSQISPSLPSSPGARDSRRGAKSIMQKFRRLREAPNAPMGGDYEDDRDGSPPSSVENYQQDGAGALSDGGGRAGRPTHRHQNSFFGRFGAGEETTQAPSQQTSTRRHTNISRTSTGRAEIGGRTYHPAHLAWRLSRSARRTTTSAGPPSPGPPITPGNSGLGRKTSLMKKVKGVVRAGQQVSTCVVGTVSILFGSPDLSCPPVSSPL